MADEFEQRLRDALHAEAARVPFAINAGSIRERVDGSDRRPGAMFAAVGLSVALVALVALAAVFVLAPDQSGNAGSPGVTSRPSLTPAAASPAPSPLGIHRSNAASASEVDRLYVVGGTDTPTSASVLDFSIGRWIELPDLPDPRVGGTAVVTSRGDLFVFGGRQNGVVTDTTLHLANGADAWAYREPMPRAGTAMAAAYHDGRVYLFGGSDEIERDVMIYDPAADAWESGTPIPTAVPRGASVALKDVILVFGGEVEPGRTRQLAYRYDPRAASWSSIPDMPLSATSLNAVVVGDDTWVFARSWVWVAPTADPNPDDRMGRVLVLDGVTDRWTVSDERTNPLPGRATQMTVPLGNGDIMVFVTSPCCSTGNTIPTAEDAEG
ncbi:MAG: hypothetical protein M3406_13985 [Chloroflexota bacterium]|nr:hypothetical protein [Chloroflexota bacterium]